MSNKQLLSISDLSVKLHGQPLIENLSLPLERGELIAVIGANGCGKTTLLELVQASVAENRLPREGDAFRFEGSISVARRINVAYLPQTIEGSENVPDSSCGVGYGIFLKLCDEFGLGEPEEAMSGGELQKRALAAVLSADSDLYLFDEPTNYLDITGITAFEHHAARLKQSGKGIILVSHDRTITDTLADKTVLLSQHGIYVTSGGAGAARMLEASEFESRRRHAKDIARKIEQLQADARAKAGWSATSERRKRGAGMDRPYFAKLSKRMAKRAKVMEKRADREIEKLARTKPFVPKKLVLNFPGYDVRNRSVFQLLNVDFGYAGDECRAPEHEAMLLRDLNFGASSRDRICLMGDNGSGKTTLLKLLQGQLKPMAGTTDINESVRVVCVPQGLENFFGHEVLLDNFGECGLSDSVVRQHLGSVLIRKEKVRQPVGSFSRGELMRAALAKCVLMRAEFLLLDEPTSHLDIESIEVLERILGQFKGGFMVVSHDRSFVANVADKLYWLGEGRLKLV